MKMKSVAMTYAPLPDAPVHCHDYWEIILNLEGYGVNFINDNKYDFSPGSILICPPGINHSKYAQNGFFKDIYVTFDDADELKKLSRFDFQDNEMGFCRQLLYMVHNIYHNYENGYKDTVNSMMEAICNLLISWDIEKKTRSRTETLKNMIIENFSDPEFDVSTVMDAAGFCKDHARRCFKKDTGMTPLEYLTYLRIKHAKKLLNTSMYTKQSIVEVAFLSGYYDALYFCRVFKKHTGISPRQYKNCQE